MSSARSFPCGRWRLRGQVPGWTTQLYIPARIPAEQTELIRQAAVKAPYRALDCRGLSQVDFFALPDGAIRLNEINTLPGFTNISMFPKLFMASGYTIPSCWTV